MNSIEHGREAMKAEISRQIKEVEAGGVIKSWTLDWDEENKTLSKMRSKETEADYRYFKEPDLLAVKMDEEDIQRIMDSLPDLPLDYKTRFISDHNLSDKEASVLTSSRALADYFDAVLKIYEGEGKTAANWLINDLLGLMNDLDLDLDELYLTPDKLAAILKLVDEGVVNSSTGKDLLRKTQEMKKDPDAIVDELGLAQVTDTGALEAICQEVIDANPSQVEEYRSGKTGVIGWLMGQVMAKSGGKADPQAIRKILTNLLKN